MQKNENKIKKEINYNAVDRFFEAFNMSRCKTAMLVISSLITIGFVAAELLQIPSENLKLIMIGVFGYWTGRFIKGKDRNINYDEYQIAKLVKKIMDEENHEKR